MMKTFYPILLWLFTQCCLHSAETKLFDEQALEIKKLNEGAYLVDFGKVTFGNVVIKAPNGHALSLKIHYGEDLKDGRVNRKPPGTVRYQRTSLELKSGEQRVASPPPNKRNTNIKKNAVLTPAEWGVVLPFRWVEIEGWKGELKAEYITRRSAYLTSWDDSSASFECSDDLLNQIWKLCQHSIKATTFAGVYVDGDRERIPYEADAYLNQLSHYYMDHDLQMARDTYDYLIKHPTWPTEWASHMVFMAYADWMHTGDEKQVARIYETLEPKLLLSRVNTDGLVESSPRDIKRTDIVDWPKTERDGFVFTPLNTVVNAFQIRSLYLMAELASAIGKNKEAEQWLAQAKKGKKAFNKIFYNEDLGGYVDGVSTEHQSIHANLFPLAFGLVPDRHKKSVTNFLTKREMDCSVYAAQYLLEALYQNGADQKAFELMTADSDRSWKHMIDSGATITWEAWDMKYKPNQDWNHAWGAAPANIIPRFILGVEAATPGWGVVNVRPSPSGLTYARGKVPTSNGPLLVSWKNEKEFQITMKSTQKVMLHLELPASPHSSGVYLSGKKLDFKKIGDRWVGDHLLNFNLTLTVK